MRLASFFAVLSLAASTVRSSKTPLTEATDDRPNIVVILTDDQDLHLGSLDYMPLLKKYIIDQGTFYKRHYCTTAICCPARVTLWTGRNAHNTNVTDVHPPYGGYPKFVAQGLNENWLPVWLQKAGYNTYYTGKLFNAHTVQNWNNPRPKGWTSSDFLLDPHTYDYLNATFQRNGNSPVSHPGEYSTDLIARKAYGLLEEGISSKKPFFLTIAPIAPHSNVDSSGFKAMSESDRSARVLMTAPIPAERHKHLFPDAKVPRNANFNPDQPGGASWVKRLAKLTDEVIVYNDDFYRKRLQTLQAVDEIVEGIVTRLKDNGILDNTFIIYSTDNGYHISQHRLPPGKECGFEEDINVPLIIRGPGISIGDTNVVTAHTDLAPTILKLAKADWGWEGLDGSPIPLTDKEIEVANEERQEHVNVEFWGKALAEGTHVFSLDDGKFVTYAANNTYKALRLVGKTYNLYYSVWCTNEHELYDLTTDPHQITNLHSLSSDTIIASLSLPLSKLVSRLDALLMVTKSCKGITCISPWSEIHPAGNVRTLQDALDAKFDGFYEALAEEVVRFDRCELGYIVESEGPQKLTTFEEWKNEEVWRGEL